METERKEHSETPWTDLPPDLLCRIGDSLGAVDLLSLRGVGKGWRSGLSTCSAEMESAPCVAPNFLLNLGDGNFKFYYRLQRMKTYTVSIPELKDTNCLASSHGWLLISRGQQDQDSVFFFCPLTRAKIDLPSFPHPDLSDHVAAFSAPPTSPEYVLAVLNRSPDVQTVELHILRRGGGEWRKMRGCKWSMRKLKVAIYVEVECSFNLVDEGDNLLKYSMKEEEWAAVRNVDVNKGDPAIPSFSFGRAHKKWLSFFGTMMCICGTSYWNNKHQVSTYLQSIRAVAN